VIFEQTILNLTKRLYPTGRAFNIPIGSWKEAFYKGLIKSENRAYSDALSILDSILPDNDNFTEQDAANWERRLGIFGNENSSLDDRKLAIERKINHPGEAKARQHYLYIEGELRKAGFDVYVHENTVGTDPTVYVGTAFKAVHATNVQHGQITHGQSNLKVVANSIDPAIDRLYSVQSPYNHLFFIGGQTLGDFADVDANRETEFRDLILNLKPVQNVAILLINYV